MFTNKAFGKYEEKNVNIVRVIIEIFFVFKDRKLFAPMITWGSFRGQLGKK